MESFAVTAISCAANQGAEILSLLVNWQCMELPLILPLILILGSFPLGDGGVDRSQKSLDDAFWFRAGGGYFRVLGQ